MEILKLMEAMGGNEVDIQKFLDTLMKYKTENMTDAQVQVFKREYQMKLEKQNSETGNVPKQCPPVIQGSQPIRQRFPSNFIPSLPSQQPHANFLNQWQTSPFNSRQQQHNINQSQQGILPPSLNASSAPQPGSSVMGTTTAKPQKTGFNHGGYLNATGFTGSSVPTNFRGNSESPALVESFQNDRVLAAIRGSEKTISTQNKLIVKLIARLILEVSSLKAVVLSSDTGTSPALVAQTLKRGRPDISVSSPNESQPQGMPRMFQPEMKGLDSKKACQPTPGTCTGSDRISEPNACKPKMAIDAPSLINLEQSHRTIPGTNTPQPIFQQYLLYSETGNVPKQHPSFVQRLKRVRVDQSVSGNVLSSPGGCRATKGMPRRFQPETKGFDSEKACQPTLGRTSEFSPSELKLPLHDPSIINLQQSHQKCSGLIPASKTDSKDVVVEASKDRDDAKAEDESSKLINCSTESR